MRILPLRLLALIRAAYTPEIVLLPLAKGREGWDAAL